MSNVIEFPPAEDVSESLFGPVRQGFDLIVDGRSIPRIHVHRRGDNVLFVLDGRFGYEFPPEWAYLAASFAANAMAIGEGFPFLGAETKSRPFAPQIHGLDAIPTK